jgi:MFS family permease
MKGSFTPPSTEATRRGLWAEAFDGIRVIGRDALLRAVVVQAPLINFAFTGAIFTVILTLKQAGKSSAVIGLTESAIMVGGLLGAIVAPRLQGRLSLERTVVVLTSVGAALLTLSAFLLPSPLIAVPLAIPFFLAPAANAALFAAMLRTTPEELRGRVSNALIQMATGLAALAPLAAGLLVEDVSSRWAMAAFAVALGVSAVMALLLKGLRTATAATTDAASA